MTDPIRYPFDGTPTPGETREVAPGVWWLRLPLPYRLDHVNLWLLEDGDGWTVVDAGIDTDAARQGWERAAAERLGGRPLKRMIVTHFHPDHVGLAGWLAGRFGAELWMPFAEWAFARALSSDRSERTIENFRAFYRRAGFGDEYRHLIEERIHQYPDRVGPVPAGVRRIADGETITIGGRNWRMIAGAGHAYEQATLFCEELGVLIAGDQILPVITPNISVWPYEPAADPLRAFLDSLGRFRGLPAGTLVLPGHRQPFVGLPGRLDVLAHHHDDRLESTLAACAEPSTGFDVLRRLFRQDLDSHQIFFAIGESLAHLHYLMGQGRVERTVRADGVYLFYSPSP